ncbi:hypothetical protein FOYG_06935 [Fusarium oxysporum NRRL 32931]|uniref:Uncharacterized protein n=1 Tax=Fusarium oxysporum NRRL 32931 TaxID=660029 RepID=W9IML3_FUSOX|nr:hypothetical protein FOYG_06935 [Fusarium oxysporum NRRL 32931]
MFRFSYFRPTRQHMMGKISYTQDRSPSVKSWTILDFGTRLVLCVLQISLGRLMCDAQQRQQLVTRVTNCALGEIVRKTGGLRSMIIASYSCSSTQTNLRDFIDELQLTCHQ